MEELDVVDDDNDVIERKSRKEVHEKGLPHRSVMFFVFSEDDEILVTQRSKGKKFFPEYWSVVLGGHVSAGDSYEDSLRREAEEEIGTFGEYEEIGSFIKDIPEETEHVRIYKITVNKDEIELLEKELKKGEFWSLEKIMDELDDRDFLPETKEALNLLREYREV